MNLVKKPLFNKNTPSCAYCRIGRVAPDGHSILCPKRGVTHAGMSCKKYQYDPLRREPKPAPILPQFSPEDFEL